MKIVCNIIILDYSILILCFYSLPDNYDIGVLMDTVASGTITTMDPNLSVTRRFYLPIVFVSFRTVACRVKTKCSARWLQIIDCPPLGKIPQNWIANVHHIEDRH